MSEDYIGARDYLEGVVRPFKGRDVKHTFSMDKRRSRDENPLQIASDERVMLRQGLHPCYIFEDKVDAKKYELRVSTEGDMAEPVKPIAEPPTLTIPTFYGRVEFYAPEFTRSTVPKEEMALKALEQAIASVIHDKAAASARIVKQDDNTLEQQKINDALQRQKIKLTKAAIAAEIAEARLRSVRGWDS